MSIFETINNLEILQVLDVAGIGYKKDSGQLHTFTLIKSDGKIDESFKINTSKNIAVDFGGNGIKGGVFDFIGRYLLKQDTQTDIGKVETIKWFVEKGLIDDPEKNKPKFIKSLGDDEILEKYESFKLGGYKQEISAFLLTRGVPYNWIQKNQLKVGEIFKDFGFYDNYYCTERKQHQDEKGNWIEDPKDKAKSVSVFLFPCYLQDEELNKYLVGIKIRRKDGKTIRGKKSIAVGHTGLLWDKLEGNQSIIVEGETDWLILSLLGYTNVVANLGGCQSHKTNLKNLLSDIPKIICLYDNDNAGLVGKISLQEVFKRPIHDIEYPIRENVKGKILVDINDFYGVGYDNKKKWDKLLSGAKKVGIQEKDKGKYDFVFIRSSIEFYDTIYKRIQDKGSVASLLGLNNKELFSMISNGLIHTYNSLCYWEGGKDDEYSVLDESVIVKHGGDAKPKLHEHIKYLIDNICNNKVRNADWIHKSILYKLTHINDVYIPAVVLYGTGKSGKGTFINLLSKIFGSENTQIGLGQKDLEGGFDSYQGEKLICEFKEVSSGNKFQDKKVLDRMKSIIGESRITINPKYGKVREVDNIARFHLSSNHPVPIQLDSKHSGNRRFTVIKTGNALDSKKSWEMNQKTLNDKQVIKEYIARLYETYPNVPKLTVLDALDNDEKRNLEESCEGVSNQFFEWVERTYPYVTKLTTVQKNLLLEHYCFIEGEDINDNRFNQSNFDLGLSHRYEKKPIRFNGKMKRGYFINKPEHEKLYFPPDTNGELTGDDLSKLDKLRF